MTPNYYRAPSHQRDRWIISYADVLTILLILFVAITAKSMEDAKRNGKAAAQAQRELQLQVAARRAAENAAQPAPENPALIEARQKLEQNGLDLHLEPEGLMVSLPQAVLFPSGEDRVSNEALPMLAKLAAVLRDIPNRVSVLGYADAMPIHNRLFQSNWDLSMARSRRIMELMSQRYGIPESRFSIASFGPYRPAGANDTADGRARNRRVEILILADTAAFPNS